MRPSRPPRSWESRASIDPNGEMMEGKGGAALADNCIRDGKRRSMFRCLHLSRDGSAEPDRADRRAGAPSDHRRSIGPAASRSRYRGQVRRFNASTEVVLALGAMHDAKVLMLSGIGDEGSLRPFGIPGRRASAWAWAEFSGPPRVLAAYGRPRSRWPPDAVGTAVMYWPSRKRRPIRPISLRAKGMQLGDPGEHRAVRNARITLVHIRRLTHPKSRGIDRIGRPRSRTSRFE